MPFLFTHNANKLKETKEAKAVLVGGALSLKNVLRNGEDTVPPFDLDTFYRFCQKDFVVENVEFWLLVEKFRKNVSNGHLLDQILYRREIERILSKYIRENAPEQLNLPNQMITDTETRARDAISKNVYDPNIFDKVQEYIFHLMNTDIYPRFVKHSTLQKRLQLSHRQALWFLNPAENIQSFSEFFTFPNPINSADTRLMNLQTCLLIALALILDLNHNFPYLYFVLFQGFLCRLICGPRLDPQMFLMIFVFRPIVQTVLLGWPENQFVPGPPKRFAELVCLILTIAGTIFRYLNLWTLYYLVFAIFFVAMFFAGIADSCIACYTFGVAMKLGIIPDSVCEECSISYIRGLNADTFKADLKEPQP